LALMDVYGRVAHLLLDMAETVDGPKGGHPEDRQAGYRQIDRSRKMVSRVMKDLHPEATSTVAPARYLLHESILTID